MLIMPAFFLLFHSLFKSIEQPFLRNLTRQFDNVLNNRSRCDDFLKCVLCIPCFERKSQLFSLF